MTNQNQNQSQPKCSIIHFPRKLKKYLFPRAANQIPYSASLVCDPIPRISILGVGRAKIRKTDSIVGVRPVPRRPLSGGRLPQTTFPMLLRDGQYWFFRGLCASTVYGVQGNHPHQLSPSPEVRHTGQSPPWGAIFFGPSSSHATDAGARFVR